MMNCQLVNQLGQLIDINKNNIFLKSFERFGGVGIIYKPFSIWEPAPIFKNQVCQVSSVLFFERVNKKELNNGKYQLLKIVRSRPIVISLKS